MKKFTFNLEPVLAYRRLTEETEQQKLQNVQATIDKARQVQANLLAEIARYSRMLTANSAGTIDIQLVKNTAAYLERLHLDAVKTSHVLSTLEEDKRRQLEKLVHARKAREVVEKLKDKNLALHEKEILAMEQKLQDEVSAERFTQRSR
jgi:flagellar export protein FliJ